MNEEERRRCCILGICCTPGSNNQRNSLAGFLAGIEAGDKSRPVRQWHLDAADRILSAFALVPAEVGRAIIEAYHKPSFGVVREEQEAHEEDTGEIPNF